MEKLILDVGCGSLPQHTSRSNIGLDIAKRPAHRPETFVCADAYHIPFQDNSFDVVLLHQVIEHLDNPKTALKEILRILKPNGKVFLATPNIYHWRRILKILLGKNPHDDTSDHIACWTHYEMTNLLRESGFRNVNVQTGSFSSSHRKRLDTLAKFLLNKKVTDLHLYACAQK